MSEITIRIPRSAVSRRSMGFAKLLTYVAPDADSGFGFEGKFLPPGSFVAEEDLWPTPEFPRPAVLLEYAGPPAYPARGHNRHAQGDVWILWRYRPGAGQWEELGRCCMAGATWASHLRPMAIQALAESRGPVAAPDPAAIRAEIAEFLTARLAGLSGAEAHAVVSAIHDDLAVRLAAPAFLRAA